MDTSKKPERYAIQVRPALKKAFATDAHLLGPHGVQAAGTLALALWQALPLVIREDLYTWLHRHKSSHGTWPTPFEVADQLAKLQAENPRARKGA